MKRTERSNRRGAFENDKLVLKWTKTVNKTIRGERLYKFIGKKMIMK
jgi:hypothetical protein